ncbi:stalk domain-containing protein [Paenibacillus sp. BAC0078]
MRNSKWFSAALASALLVTGGAGSILATSTSASAAAVKTVAVKEGSTTWTVNGASVTLSTINSGGYKLYSLSQVAGELGAKLILSSNGFELNDSKGLHTVQIKTGAKSYQVDGAAQQFTVAPVSHNGKVYVELTKLVLALGGELQADDQTIMSFARPEGLFDTLHWNANGNVIANKSDSDTAQIIKFSEYPGDYEVFSSNDSALDFAVSADQKWGAFSDETGQLKLINLASGAISSLGTDTSVKTDLVWSEDGKTIYFIQGDKQEKIAQASVETGAVKTVLEDKVENKSELRISPDGKNAVYIVNVTGVAKNDADSTEDSLSVDYSKAGEQLYKLDLATKDAKPVALTTELDNKLYPEILANGNVVYLSADPDGNAANTLKSIGADGKISNIALDVEALWAEGTTAGLIVSGAAADGSTTIYSINANGDKTQLFHTSEDVSEVSASHDGSKLAIVSDGKVLLIQGGKAVQLSK